MSHRAGAGDEDMLGLSERVNRLVMRSDDLAPGISAASEAFAGEVRARTLPGEQQTCRTDYVLLAGFPRIP